MPYGRPETPDVDDMGVELTALLSAGTVPRRGVTGNGISYDHSPLF